MGHAIERIARERGHEIAAIIDIDNRADMQGEAFASADVAIEFTRPETAEANCREAIGRGVAVVSGSTGWKSRVAAVEEEARRRGVSMMWSSNYSLGVNLFFMINRYVAKMMAGFSQYVPSMLEVHHVHKLDHPSGTAVSLAEDIVEISPALDGWSEEPAPAKMTLSHQRTGEVPGTHTISWTSPVDVISIEHRALSRDGFALGAVIAAEWLSANPGVHSMDDLLTALTRGA